MDILTLRPGTLFSFSQPHYCEEQFNGRQLHANENSYIPLAGPSDSLPKDQSLPHSP